MHAIHAADRGGRATVHQRCMEYVKYSITVPEANGRGQARGALVLAPHYR